MIRLLFLLVRRKVLNAGDASGFTQRYANPLRSIECAVGRSK